MKVWFFGSTQTKHIEKVFSSCGYEVLNSKNKHNGILSKFETLFKLLKSDTIYCVSGIDINKSSFFRLAAFLRKRIIVHWIGTDVLTFTQKYNESKKVINKNCINLSGSELLQKELREIGIESAVVPIVPTDFAFVAQKMPDKHAVLVYIPETREDFYDMPLLKAMAERFPKLDFHIVANTGKNDLAPLSNVHYHGFLNSDEMLKLYEQCSILFRYPKHDGLSMMVLEALGYGKSVIYKYEFPFVETPKNTTENGVAEAFERVLSVKPAANYEAIEFINSEFSLDKQIEKYNKAGVFLAKREV